MKDSHSRSVVKGISWRALGTIDTMIISYFVTGDAMKALSIGGIEVFTKVALYYFHERIWQGVKRGRAQLPVEAAKEQPKPEGTPKQATNIHPVFEQLTDRADRQKLLGQKSKVLWLTGLSGSGKSTIAEHLERKLLNEGYFAQVLDGDNIRSGINNNLGFSLEDRQENIRRIAEVSKLYLNSGIITICTFISPTREIRAFAKNIIGEEDFLEIYINAPLEACEERDVKGLYKKARNGEIKEFTGIDSPYEAPENPDFEVRTDQETIGQSVERIFDFILPYVQSEVTMTDYLIAE